MTTRIVPNPSQPIALTDNKQQLEKEINGISKKWENLRFPVSILKDAPECAIFLIKSGLAFAIAGYRATCNDPNQHDVKLDFDGHPMLKMQGRFTRWEAITEELKYDPKSDRIKSRNDEALTWNYFHPDGLVLKDRFNYKQVYPIYTLSTSEYENVLTQAKKFYETNLEIEPHLPKDCVVQFFTSPRQQGLPNHPLLENVHKSLPVHIGIRLITSDKQVYSFGFQMSFEEQNQVLSNLTSTYLTTAQTSISMLDYEEFRQHEGRITTSIPLTSARCQDILDFISETNQKHIRFQFMRQNCSNLAEEVVQRSGYNVDTRIYGTTLIYEAFPNLNQLPIVGPLIAKIEEIKNRIWMTLPQWIGNSAELMKTAIFFIPKKTGTILFNLLAWKMGAGTMMRPLPKGIEDEDFYNNKTIRNFSRVIRYWVDLLEDETSRVYHSKYFIDWQNKQKSTFIEKYQGSPRLSIVPTQKA